MMIIYAIVLAYLVGLTWVVGALVYSEIDERRKKDQRVSQIYLNALHYQTMLDKAFDADDELRQRLWLDQLSGLSVEAIELFGVEDDGTTESDIVRDLVYCAQTPDETREKLRRYRRRRHQESTEAPATEGLSSC